ncbi:MAG: hypothetical protein AB7K04_09395 [Pseudorhodoplanes sp.]
MSQGKRESPDILTDAEVPDAARRRDQPQADAPATVPRPDEETSYRGGHAEDGGVAQHPVHDDDLEDLEPDDYEEMIDAVDSGGFESVDPPGKR